MRHIAKLSGSEFEAVKSMFRDVFTSAPWNDDWSDEKQLTAYIEDLMLNRNSCCIGMYENDRLIAVSLGSIMHWCSGTEYYIFEYFVRPDMQGSGIGSDFIKKIEEYVKSIGVTHIFLATDRSMPAYKFYLRNGFDVLRDHVSLVKQF